jgi:nucleoside-diphosphate-sugar epimerase
VNGRPRASRRFVAAALTLAAAITLTACATAPKPLDLKTAKVVVVGASGRNGSAIVDAFEAAGMRPIALTRDVARAKEKRGDHDWQPGDVTDPESLAKAFKGADVVVDAAATTQLDGPNGTDAVDRVGAGNVAAAAKKAGVKRILLITGMSVGLPIPDAAPMPMRRVFTAKREGERLFEQSGVPYVILRPTGIVDMPAGKWAVALTDPAKYAVASEEVRPRAASREELAAMSAPPKGVITVGDLARVAVFAATHPSAANKTVVISHVYPAVPTRDDWAAQFEAIPAVPAKK